jgi:hypothetical protein
MNIFFVLYCFVDLLIWGIVPARQRRGKYFLFFLILISGEIIATVPHFIFTYSIFYYRANFIYIGSAVLRLISIQEKKIRKFFALSILAIIIIIVSLEIHGLTYKQEFAVLSILHFLLLFYFLKDFIVKLVVGKTISVFIFCLIFYEITATSKYFGLITGFANAGSYLIVTTVFEVLIGIFFCIFREDSPRILINLEKLSINA